MAERFLGLIFLFMVPLAGAESTGEIPLRFVFFQVFNFSLFVLALFFLLKKKIPRFLQQNQKDFIEYRNKASVLEKQNHSAFLLLEKKVHALTKKEKHIESTVAKALENLKEEWEAREKQEIKVLREQVEQKLRRIKIKALNELKTRFLSSVMQKTKEQVLSAGSEKFEKLNHQMIQKWEQV